MDEGQTSFEISLPGPTLEAPLLFARHAERIEGWLRSRYPEGQGYRVTAEKVDDAKRLRWTVRVDAGWLSGLEVKLVPKKGEPHNAQLSVQWSTRLFRALSFLGALGTVLLGLVLLGVGVKLIGSLLLAGLLVIPLAFVALFVVGGVVALIAGAASKLAGNSFDGPSRAALALQLKDLSLQSTLRK